MGAEPLVLVWDIETNGLDPRAPGAKILSSVIVTVEDEPRICVWANGHNDGVQLEQMDLLRDPNTIVVGHNLIAFDIPWWEEHCASVNGQPWDTMLAAGLIDETGEANSLDGLAQRYLGEKPDAMKKKRQSLEDVDVLDLVAYNERDVLRTKKIYEKLAAELDASNMTALHEWLNYVALVVQRMSYRGITIDEEWVTKNAEVITAELEELESTFVGAQGINPKLNVYSTQQLNELFFDPEGLDLDPDRLGLERTKTGQVCLNADAIRTLAKAHRGDVRHWFEMLLRIRELKKLRDTYLLPLRDKHAAGDGRIHTQYHLVKTARGGTVTGRLASAKPNLQNIPRDPRVKGSFVPNIRHWRLFDADYAQLELRVAAWYSGEERMLNAFAAGQDLHTATLAIMLERPYEGVVADLESGDPKIKEMRVGVKRCNFGILYGAGPYTISRIMESDLGRAVPLSYVSNLMDNWFAAYPTLSKWMESVRRQARCDGAVATPVGRIRHLPEIRSSISDRVARATRQSVNFLVQSLASDIMLTALTILEEEFSEIGDGEILLTVHDSVVGEYDPVAIPQIEAVVRSCMTDLTNDRLGELWGIRPLPLEVDVATNKERWGD